MRPEGTRPDGGRFGDASSSAIMGDDVPLPLPPASGTSGGDLAVPKMVPGETVKAPRGAAPSRARPPVHATNPVA